MICQRLGWRSDCWTKIIRAHLKPLKPCKLLDGPNKPWKVPPGGALPRRFAVRHPEHPAPRSKFPSPLGDPEWKKHEQPLEAWHAVRVPPGSRRSNFCTWQGLRCEVSYVVVFCLTKSTSYKDFLTISAQTQVKFMMTALLMSIILIMSAVPSISLPLFFSTCWCLWMINFFYISFAWKTWPSDLFDYLLHYNIWF